MQNLCAEVAFEGGKQNFPKLCKNYAILRDSMQNSAMICGITRYYVNRITCVPRKFVLHSSLCNARVEDRATLSPIMPQMTAIAKVANA